MKRQQGFTLIELVMVVIITGIIGSFIGKILVTGFNSYLVAKPIISLAGKGNLAIESLMREIRSAESVSSISTNALTFVNQQGQTIALSLSGSNLMRAVNGAAGQIACDQVSSLAFAGYTTAFASTSVAASTYFITMAMTLGSGTTTYSLMAGTLLRRLFNG